MNVIVKTYQYCVLSQLNDNIFYIQITFEKFCAWSGHISLRVTHGGAD